MMRSTIIGIAGGTGSGKTTLAKAVLDRFAGRSITLVHQDSYYKDLSHVSPAEREKTNFDHPDALDNDLLVRHLKELKKGKAVKKPIYDFKSHSRERKTLLVEPCDIMLLEGILIFEDRRIIDLLDIKIYVDTDADIRLIRRIDRDIKERDRNLDSVIKQYLSTVRPMHYEFVEQSKRYADVIIPEGGHNTIAVDMIVSRIESILSERMVSK